MGLGRFFFVFRRSRVQARTCSGTNTKSQHAFVHLTSPNDEFRKMIFSASEPLPLTVHFDHSIF